SPRAVNSSSDTSPRRVRVRAATTTEPILSATGSRVRTRTGRSPPGVAANQISPRRIGPVRPVLRWAPVGHLPQRRLLLAERTLRPSLGVVLARQPEEVTAQGVPEEVGTIDAQTFDPPLRFGGFLVVDAETEHRHTTMIVRMTFARSEQNSV